MNGTIIIGGMVQLTNEASGEHEMVDLCLLFIPCVAKNGKWTPINMVTPLCRQSEVVDIVKMAYFSVCHS